MAAATHGDEDAASRWHAESTTYDSWFDRPWGSYASRVERDLLLDSIGPLHGRSVCDAGCGTGRFTTSLEPEAAIVVGVDRDAPSLAIAVERVRCPLLRADVHQLPFVDASFDVTVAVTVCEFTADPAAVVAELVRVTRPGGRVVIGSLNPNSPWGWWNRRGFHGPPWDTARFQDRRLMGRIGRVHGTVTWSQGLYAPAALPGVRLWGPVLERAARRIAPRHGAFEVMTITLADQRQPGRGAYGPGSDCPVT